MVEFALVALPLLLIVFGILDFARALNYYNNMTQLTGQGARAAAVNQNPDGTAPSNQSIQHLIWAAAPKEMRSTSPVWSVCIPNAPANVGDPVTVTATYQFHFIPLVRKLTLTLSASQTERYESGTPNFSTGCVSS